MTNNVRHLRGTTGGNLNAGAGREWRKKKAISYGASFSRCERSGASVGGKNSNVICSAAMPRLCIKNRKMKMSTSAQRACIALSARIINVEPWTWMRRRLSAAAGRRWMAAGVMKAAASRVPLEKRA